MLLPIDSENIRDVIVVLGIILCLMVLATPVHAQIGGTACTIVGGQESQLVLTEDSTAEQSLSDIDTQDSSINQSVNTGGGAGRFEPQAQYLNSLMQTMASGVADANTFAGLYPGWVDFGANGANSAANITYSTLSTYADAITIAQSQAADFNAEDTHFEALEACNAASGITLLQAVQCGNEINLAVAQQTQLLRQIEITRLIVEAVHDGEQLNERSQGGAHDETTLTTAAQQ
jgi:hypothetical protein